MLFNSIEFLIFLPTIFILYWFVFNKNLKFQNSLILFSSYVFYGWWDFRFLSLIFLSTVIDYFIGLNIARQESKKKQKLLLWCSVLFNLGILGFFKYYNFFINSWVDVLNSIGYEINNVWTLNIILPVGISFYTFQTMSYAIDIYRKKLEPTKDFISFASFVSFFPQLVAGPIERASNLLPQILCKRKFKYEQGVQGLRLILWGMFKKVVIADSLAPLVNEIFRDYEILGGGELWLGAIYFGFQAYADFSGYSDIAIGTAYLFGIKLISNFNYPFFSRNIAEFWRRWHISMTTWFTDYLFIPLKLHFRNSNFIVNFLILFLYFNVIGLWHGANLTFMFFGIYHCLLFSPSIKFPLYFKLDTNHLSENRILPDLKDLLKVGKTFLLVTIGWVFFRSETIMDSFNYISSMFLDISLPKKYRSEFINVVLFFLIEYCMRKDERLTLNISKNWLINYILFSIILFAIISNFYKKSEFIYFQF